MSCERRRLCRRDIVLVGSIIENIDVLASTNRNSWTTIIVSNVVVNLYSSTIVNGLIVIDNNTFAVRNFAGIGLVFVANIILIIIKDIAVHKNLGSLAPVTVGTS